LRLLLDTHVLLWCLAEPARLPADFRRSLDTAEVFVSAASIWEIAIKRAIGKIDVSADMVLDAVEPSGFRHLAINGAHAAAVARLPVLHKDPFDRILVAQALVEPLHLVTHDAALLAYGDLVQLVE
jgi:PIN domain nuclease of toxin-antitoxin system